MRELQNVVERAVILARGGVISFELPDAAGVVVAEGGEVVTEREWRLRERANLLAALEKAGGKVSGAGGAAELLGVHPATLASRLRALGLTRGRR